MPRLLSIKQAMFELGIGRTGTYELVRDIDGERPRLFGALGHGSSASRRPRPGFVSRTSRCS